ncbi:hypothetical protein MDA_GLEAN10002818 [Myotis davidii]|uniref:Uncharacterized protein n=1 Tax=Myotis davidii TaxID=225400 RepID=L5LIN2_MYODS|nr:hypothetical protein MDA_GLEAN10002818 [Myotis davidii]
MSEGSPSERAQQVFHASARTEALQLPTGSYSRKVASIPHRSALLSPSAPCSMSRATPGVPVLCSTAQGHRMQMKPKQEQGPVPCSHRGALLHWNMGSTHPGGRRAGSGCHPRASAAALEGVEVGLVGAVVVQSCMVHVRSMARMVGMVGVVKVSQAAPGWEEPRPGLPNSVSPYSWTVHLHIVVLLSTVQAGGQHQQQQQNGQSSACDQAHESRAPQEPEHLGAGESPLLKLEAQCRKFVPSARPAPSQSGTPRGMSTCRLRPDPLSWQADMPLAVWGSHSSGPLAPYHLPTEEVEEAPATAAALAGCEAGLWLSSTLPLWEHTDHQGGSSCIEHPPPGGQCTS